MVATLKIKNADGEWVDIPAIKGDTPVKGIDYFTEEDKQELVNDVLANFPVYEGTYNISPSRQTQILETANKVLSDNVTIAEIAYSEVSNNSGGTTYYIAKE